MQMRMASVDTLSRNWWIVLLRGVAGVIFGLLTFLAPVISLAGLVLAFGAYAFADGVLAIVSALRRRGTAERWWVLLIEGIAGIAAGILTFLYPGMTAIVLLYVIAGWAIVTGILEIVAAIRLRRIITREWLLALSGVVSVVLGVLLALFPGPGALALVLWIGAYALVFGALLIGLGIRLRGWQKAHPTTPARAAPGIA